MMEESPAWTVRLDPFAFDYELGNGPFADIADNFLGSAWDALDIDLGIGDLVLLEEAFGFAAIAAPGS